MSFAIANRIAGSCDETGDISTTNSASCHIQYRIASLDFECTRQKKNEKDVSQLEKLSHHRDGCREFISSVAENHISKIKTKNKLRLN